MAAEVIRLFCATSVKQPPFDENKKTSEVNPNGIVEAVARPCLCAVGSLLQGAKTLIKLPFTAIVMPFAFILEKVAEFLENNKLRKIAEEINFGFSKDLIMTIHLVHFTFSDKKDEYSLRETLQLNFEVVAGIEESYNEKAEVLWARYLYGKAPGNK